MADAAEVSTGQQTTKLQLLDSLVNGTGDSLQAGEMPGTYVPAAYSPHSTSILACGGGQTMTKSLFVV